GAASAGRATPAPTIDATPPMKSRLVTSSRIRQSLRGDPVAVHLRPESERQDDAADVSRLEMHRICDDELRAHLRQIVCHPDQITVPLWAVRAARHEDRLVEVMRLAREVGALRP